MPRFRDTRTGVVVDVDDETGESLGAAYEPVRGEVKPAKKSATAPAKSDK